MNAGFQHEFDQEKRGGLFVFVYCHSFQFDHIKKAVKYDVWFHVTVSDSIIDAQKSLEKAATQMGFFEDIKRDPSNLHIQAFGEDFLEESLALLDGEDPVKLDDEDMTLMTEDSHKKMLQKNRLMKRIVSEKNIELLQNSHDVLTPEEVHYLHDKITKK